MYITKLATIFFFHGFFFFVIWINNYGHIELNLSICLFVCLHIYPQTLILAVTLDLYRIEWSVLVICDLHIIQSDTSRWHQCGPPPDLDPVTWDDPPVGAGVDSEAHFVDDNINMTLMVIVFFMYIWWCCVESKSTLRYWRLETGLHIWTCKEIPLIDCLPRNHCYYKGRWSGGGGEWIMCTKYKLSRSATTFC